MSQISRKAMVVWGTVSIVALVVALGAGWYAFVREDEYQFKGGTYEPTNPAAALDLVDQRGEPFSLADQSGKVVLVYFGYTFCPDFCPTTMLELQRVQEMLGTDAESVEVVMVTVDPERDPPARMGEYMNFFNPEFYGLSGSVEQTEQVKRDWGVLGQKRAAEGASQYLVDHTTSLFAVDTTGSLCVIWAYGTSPDDIAADIEHLLDS